jgi:hypothetical protein
MNGSERSGWIPFRAICVVLVLAVGALGLSVATGSLEIRRPSQTTSPTNGHTSSKCYVQRNRVAESLLEKQDVRWVYQFAGGLPKCWAEIDSENQKQMLGPWISLKAPGLVGPEPLDRPIPESVEGYVALFGPTSKAGKYRLVCAVTRVEYPRSSKREFQTGGFRDEVEVTLPDSPPAREQTKREGPGVSGGGGYLNDGDELRFVQPGKNEELNFLIHQETPAKKDRGIRLWLRFFTADELAAVGK